MIREQNKTYKYWRPGNEEAYYPDMRYVLKGTTLIINILGTDTKAEWLDNFKLFRLVTVKTGRTYHYDLGESENYLNRIIELPETITIIKSNMAKIPGTKIKVHRPWLMYSMQYTRFIEQKIIPDNKVTKIIYVGVSMGGACAALCQQIPFWYNKSAMHIPTFCYCYDSPRPTNKKLRSPIHWYNRFSFVHWLPFWRPPLGDTKCTGKFYFGILKNHTTFEKEWWL